MNKKLKIAIAAILTFTLILSGCAVLPQSVEAAADDTRPYGNAIREDDGTYGSGTRGRGSYAATDSVTEVGNGNGNGAGTNYTDSCDPLYDGTTTADPDYTLTETDQAL
jgi:hypothetical protein